MRDIAHVEDMIGGGPFKLKPGEWTDDTSMAIRHAEACIESGRVDINLFRDKMVDWYKHGVNSVNGYCFDIGNATRSSFMAPIGWETLLLILLEIQH